MISVFVAEKPTDESAAQVAGVREDKGPQKSITSYPLPLLFYIKNQRIGNFL